MFNKLLNLFLGKKKPKKEEFSNQMQDYILNQILELDGSSDKLIKDSLCQMNAVLVHHINYMSEYMDVYCGGNYQSLRDLIDSKYRYDNERTVYSFVYQRYNQAHLKKMDQNPSLNELIQMVNYANHEVRNKTPITKLGVFEVISLPTTYGLYCRDSDTYVQFFVAVNNLLVTLIASEDYYYLYFKLKPIILVAIAYLEFTRDLIQESVNQGY